MLKLKVHLAIDILDRSFPSHKMFIQGTSEGKEGRAALFRVLAVYAMYNPEVSYCQGMRPPYIKHFVLSLLLGPVLKCSQSYIFFINLYSIFYPYSINFWHFHDTVYRLGFPSVSRLGEKLQKFHKMAK